MRISDLNLATHHYQTKEVLLLPYSQKNREMFPADIFHRFHDRLMQDGNLETVFAGMPDCQDRQKWVAYISKQPVVLYVIKPETLVGFGWIAQVEGVDNARKAAFGFFFVRGSWGTQLVRDLCWLSLDWWYEELNIDILYATSLRTNRMAVNFSRNFGFTFLCHLPMFFNVNGELKDGTLICLKRSDFRPKVDSWRESLAIRYHSENVLELAVQ